MASDDGRDPGDPTQAFLAHLENSGFFRQIGELEKNLKTIADDLKVLGEATLKRIDEIENLVAHVLAIEAILTVLLKTQPVDAEAVQAVIREKTAGISGSDEGSPLVHAVVEDLLKRARG